MSLSKICLLVAFCYTLMNVTVAGYFGHPWLGVLVSIPANIMIWGIWAAVRSQVYR